jgi:hypothetical protein
MFCLFYGVLCYDPRAEGRDLEREKRLANAAARHPGKSFWAIESFVSKQDQNEEERGF